MKINWRVVIATAYLSALALSMIGCDVGDKAGVDSLNDMRHKQAEKQAAAGNGE